MKTNPSDPTLAALPAAVRAALEKGQWIEAIKLLRSSGGVGLKEAKKLIEQQRADAAQANATQAKPAPPKGNAVDSHRAPGEVPRTPGKAWLILVVVLALVALLAHRLFASPG